MKIFSKNMRLFLLAFVAVLMLQRMDIRAAVTIAEGSCGDSAAFTLDDKGNLTITGTGEIRDEAFGQDTITYAEQIKKVTIADGIIGIGEEAFSWCENMTSISIPKSVTGIGAAAFWGCTGLTEIILPENLTTISDSMFAECTGLISMSLPQNVTTIGASAFSSCTALKNISISECVTDIGEWAFEGCSALESISIPQKVKALEYSIFDSCGKLKKVEIYNDKIVFQEDESGDSLVIPSKTTIYGHKDSSAYVYATEHGNKFVELKTVKNSQTTEAVTATKLTTKNTTIKLSKKSYTYDGNAKIPTVKVINSKGKTLKKDYYTVTYKNNVKVGKATLTIKFQGKYTGSIKAIYTIKPKKTAMTGTSPKTDRITLTWKKQTRQVTGYQIQYATDSAFTKNKTTVVVAGAKKSSETITGLSGKTKYYFRIRTYMTVNGKKYYSEWSKSRAVKTR